MHKFNVILLLIDGARVDRISKFPIFQNFIKINFSYCILKHSNLLYI